MIGLLKAIVYLPISLKENSKRISGNSLSPLEAQNKDIGRCFADVTNQSEVTYATQAKISSDFVTNTYSASWDSSCEKSWVLVHKQ